jgi:hypothetical protein
MVMLLEGILEETTEEEKEEGNGEEEAAAAAEAPMRQLWEGVAERRGGSALRGDVLVGDNYDDDDDEAGGGGGSLGSRIERLRSSVQQLVELHQHHKSFATARSTTSSTSAALLGSIPYNQVFVDLSENENGGIDGINLDPKELKDRSVQLGMLLFDPLLPTKDDADDDADLQRQLRGAERELQEIKAGLSNLKEDEKEEEENRPHDATTHHLELRKEATMLHRQLRILHSCRTIQPLLDRAESLYESYLLLMSGAEQPADLVTAPASAEGGGPLGLRLATEAIDLLLQAERASQDLQSGGEGAASSSSSFSSPVSAADPIARTLLESLQRQERNWQDQALKAYRVEVVVASSSHDNRAAGGPVAASGNLFTPSSSFSIVVPAIPAFSYSGSASLSNSSLSGSSSSAWPLQFCYHVLEALAPWKLEALVRQFCRDLSSMAGLLPRSVPPDLLLEGSSLQDKDAKETDAKAAATITPDRAATIQFREWKFYEVNRPKQGRVLEWMVRDPGDSDEEDDQNEDDDEKAKKRHEDRRHRHHQDLGTIREAEREDDGTHDDSGSRRQLDRLALAWKRQTQNWERVLRFCSQHVWLGRPDLLAVAGRYLFARPSARPRTLDMTSFGLESTRLGDDHGLWLEPLLNSLREDWVPECGDDYDQGGGVVVAASGMNLTLPERLALSSSHLEATLTLFVGFLIEQGLVPAGDEESYAREKLLGLPGQLIQLYADRRRCSILERARDKIVSLDYHSTVEVEDEPFPASLTGPSGQLAPALDHFRVTRCAVSMTAFEAMKLCRMALDEAAIEAQRLRAELLALTSSSSPSSSRAGAAAQLQAILPWALYRSARDVLDLFRSLIPTLHGTDIASVPRIAAVFHNDCSYLAHRCLTLGLEYRDSLFPSDEEGELTTKVSAGAEPESETFDLFSFLQKGPASDEKPPTARSSAPSGQSEAAPPRALLRQTCTFVDMVPLFRDLAEKAMGDVLVQHAKELAELVVGPRISLFGPSLRCDSYMQEWTDAEAGANAGLHHVRRLHFVWKPVLSDDILRRSTWYLLDVVLGLLVDQVGSARDISTSAGRFVSGLFASTLRAVLELTGVGTDDASASRSLDRFRAYGSFMDMTLADVNRALSDGGFRSVTSTFLFNLLTEYGVSRLREPRRCTACT